MLTDIFLIGIGLSMDSFAVAVCKGLAMKKLNVRKALIIGLYFGFFQGFMPVVGYLLGSSFESLVTSIDHWIAFILLGFIGAGMIKEALSDEQKAISDDVSFKEMIFYSVATSIDALAAGITFAFMNINILTAFAIIFATTFTLSVIGVAAGRRFGARLGNNAQILGGIVLIGLGAKILLEHLGIIH